MTFNLAVATVVILEKNFLPIIMKFGVLLEVDE